MLHLLYQNRNLAIKLPRLQALEKIFVHALDYFSLLYQFVLMSYVANIVEAEDMLSAKRGVPTIPPVTCGS